MELDLPGTRVNPILVQDEQAHVLTNFAASVVMMSPPSSQPPATEVGDATGSDAVPTTTTTTAAALNKTPATAKRRLFPTSPEQVAAEEGKEEAESATSEEVPHAVSQRTAARAQASSIRPTGKALSAAPLAGSKRKKNEERSESETDASQKDEARPASTAPPLDLESPGGEDVVPATAASTRATPKQAGRGRAPARRNKPPSKPVFWPVNDTGAGVFEPTPPPPPGKHLTHIAWRNGDRVDPASVETPSPLERAPRRTKSVFRR